MLIFLGRYLAHMDTRCNACGGTFQSSAELSQHIRAHEFRCDACNMAFPGKAEQIEHAKKAHAM
jgi:uncharacterized C2H2 Zn-finger protein